MTAENDSTERMLAEFNYHQQWPAFVGQYEFTISMEILGVPVERRARFEYNHTPAWEYFDLHQKTLRTGWEAWGFKIYVLAEPQVIEDEDTEGNLDAKRSGDHPLDLPNEENDHLTRWVHMEDLMKHGILSEDMIDKIFSVVDEKCRAEDRERRRAAGL